MATPEQIYYGESAKNLLKRWDSGAAIHTIAMGGMSPGYEQAIQITAMEMVRYMLANPVDWAKTGRKSKYWTDYLNAMDKMIFVDGGSCERLGLSGAQHGAAGNLAAHFVRRGPAAVMSDKAVADRRIQASKIPPAAAKAEG